ncbi:hypothetical protein [Clostridium botulinum]|uniref:hypothetical protein n=1 Tax=Clostridium botulinum TaxID=1491 RepID=UPI000B286C24|nr:hypothetical protein [Clostridium botulinum]
MKIPISFKRDEEYLYDFLKGKKSPSIYVKELLETEMQKKDVKKIEEENNDEYDGFDF